MYVCAYIQCTCCTCTHSTNHECVWTQTWFVQHYGHIYSPVLLFVGTFRGYSKLPKYREWTNDVSAEDIRKIEVGWATTVIPQRCVQYDVSINQCLICRLIDL